MGGYDEKELVMSNSHDYCIVCAEHLEFTAYGPCGHKDTCSKCVMRLRTVMKDDRCVYCQQPMARVFVTRYAGDYTKSLSGKDFEDLGHLGSDDVIKEAQAYFDDTSHCEELKSMCRFSHPLIRDGKRFSSLKALKQELKATQNAQFCPICVEGRKVFISEQLIYTKQQLNKHMKQGDDDGPMSRSTGFKGHPECVYCSKRFYGENEQYEHMTRVHEECFLCKRANPHTHVYYQNYSALEVHFGTDHHMCMHQSCLDKKFVVFSTEHELKTHMAREHGGDMTKSEKKQALSLPVGFTFSDRRSSQHAHASQSAAHAELPADVVTIGGDANMTTRSRNSNRMTTSTTKIEIEDRLAQVRLSQHSRSSSTNDPSVQRFSETDFPTMMASSSAGMPAVGGTWAGSSAPHLQKGRTPSVEEFPALPGTSKSAKRRAAKKRSVASVVGVQGQTRILHSATSSSRSADAFPALGPVVTESMRRANETLANRIKSKIGNEKTFTDFKESSASWAAGKMTTVQYYTMAVSLNLSSLLPDIAATCANEEKRKELLNIIQSESSSRVSSVTCQGQGTWQCSVCSLINITDGSNNSGKSAVCEACEAPRTVFSQPVTSLPAEDEFPSLGGPASTSAQTKKSNASKTQKQGKQSLSDFYKNTQVHPQNVWKNPNLKGEWASKGAGQLAQRERALKDAYSKK